MLTREARDMALPQLVEVTPAEVLDQIDQKWLATIAGRSRGRTGELYEIQLTPVLNYSWISVEPHFTLVRF